MYTGQTRMSVLKQLVKLEATKIFMKLIIELHTKSVGSTDVLINELLFILGQLSQKGDCKNFIRVHIHKRAQTKRKIIQFLIVSRRKIFKTR